MLKTSPLHTPKANQISTTIFFYSKKLRRQVWCQSNLEWDVAILLEHDPFVKSYCEHGIELKWSKSVWTPDFVVFLKIDERYKILIIEVKYLKDLLEKKMEFIKKFSETQKWIDENRNDLSNQITDINNVDIEFIVVTDQIVNQSFRIYNLRKLMQATIDPMVYIEIKKHIKAILSKKPRIRIRNLVESINLKLLPESVTIDDIWSTLYAMIYHFELNVNIDELLTEKSFLYEVNTFRSNYKPLDTWFRTFDWEKQQSVDSSVTFYNDVYAISNNPKKSIELWEEANSRLEIIYPLLGTPIKRLKQMKFKKDGQEIFWLTVYRWILAYNKSGGDIKSLIPKYNQRGRKKVQKGLTEELCEIGLSYYLQMERKSIKRAHELMQAYALEQGQLEHCLSYSSFRRRLKSISQKEVIKQRRGEKAIENLFNINTSEFPHGTYVLQSVQIDHTPIDVLVVDEEYRLVTERPYITIAFDSHSRCVLGYYITYDSPSRLSIAMTLINCIQNKKESLLKVREQFPDLDSEKLGILESSEWCQVFGLPYTLHMDNGSDFTSEDIRLFGLKYGVHLHYRAVKKPQHGAYVERFLGTLNNRLHSIAGTTYSNPTQRENYPSEKRASFTIDELEARIITEIALYHEEYHSQIRTNPLAKWKQSFSLISEERGINRNLLHVDNTTFKFDVLPSELRTVQKSGIEIFGLKYANEEIEQYIGSKDPINTKRSQKFRIRFDPRDIRIIYFYDHIRGYIELNCTDRFVNIYFREKSLSLWDWNAIKADKNLEGRKEEDMERKLRLLSLQQEIDQKAAEKTKSARQKHARRKCREKSKPNYSNKENDRFTKNNDDTHINPEVFQIEKPERLKTIKIPSKIANPFSGITKKKAGDLAKRKKR
ncbi:MAG: Mu transposase C-terminal domain-containing protein [Promethearchaeota archaeon]